MMKWKNSFLTKKTCISSSKNPFVHHFSAKRFTEKRYSSEGGHYPLVYSKPLPLVPPPFTIWCNPLKIIMVWTELLPTFKALFTTHYNKNESILHITSKQPVWIKRIHFSMFIEIKEARLTIETGYKFTRIIIHNSKIWTVWTCGNVLADDEVWHV